MQSPLLSSSLQSYIGRERGYSACIVHPCGVVCHWIPVRVLHSCSCWRSCLVHKYIHLVYLQRLEYYYTYHQRCRIVVLSFSRSLRFSDSQRSLRFSFSRFLTLSSSRSIFSRIGRYSIAMILLMSRLSPGQMSVGSRHCLTSLPPNPSECPPNASE